MMIIINFTMIVKTFVVVVVIVVVVVRSCVVSLMLSYDQKLQCCVRDELMFLWRLHCDKTLSIPA